MIWGRSALLAAAASLTLAACGGSSAAPGAGASSPTQAGKARPGKLDRGTADVSKDPVVTLPPATAWEPSSAEEMPNAKRIAARVSESITTYSKADTAETVAAAIAQQRGLDRAVLAGRIAPAVKRGAPSVGEVVYPEIAGVTPTDAAVMVLVRQRSLRGDGSLKSVTRVIDVRLARAAGGPWRVSEIGGVGGREVVRPAGLPREADAALSNAALTLPDSARWDVFRGGVDPALLAALSDAADRQPISVLVLSSGHPTNVFATGRMSAHTAGKAADIYAIGGQLVAKQRAVGSVAYDAASAFVRGGAAQVGSPWNFGVGRRSFTDAVHRDHVHVQWTPTG